MRALLSTRPRRVAALVLALFLIAGTAWAVWIALAPVDGSVSTADAPQVTWTANGGSVGDCTTAVDSGKLTINMAGAVPGSACEATASLSKVAGSGAGVIQGVRLDDANGWTEGVELTTGLAAGTCGLALDNTTTSRSVTILVEVLEGAQPNTAYTLSGGVEVVPPAMYDAAAC